MRYANVELLRQLGAEYVLGTLRGPARRRFERLLGRDPEAQAQVDFWEQRLAEFGQALEPIAPPAPSREALLARIDAVAALPTHAGSTPAPRRRRSFRRRRLQRWAAGLTAGAACLVGAFLVGQQNAPTPSVRPLAEAGERLPIYLGQLGLPGSSTRWLLSLSHDHRHLTVEAAEDLLTLGRHTLQLWWMSPTRGPVPIGVLPANRDGIAVIELPADLRSETQARFLLSLEPEGGPHSGRPSGAVLNTTAELGLI